MWNNRIVRLIDDSGRTYYAVCEVFYEEDGTPRGYGVIEDLVGETPQDVKDLVHLIHYDLFERDLPVLNGEDL